MEKYLKFLILCIAVVSAQAIAIAADDKNYTVPVTPGEKLEYVDDGPIKNRAPSLRIICTISQSEGITMNGHAFNFLSYEIWDTEGEICFGAFTDETAFISYLFSIEGEYQLRFITEEYSLLGNIFIY